MRKTFRLKGAFSAHFLPNMKVNVWPTKKLPQKKKKIFVKKNKFFSAELGTALLKYKIKNLFFLQNQNKNELYIPKNFTNKQNISQNKEKENKGNFGITSTNLANFKQNIWIPKKHFLKNAFNVSNSAFKNFWFLKNAALVPGIHKIRKAKSFSLVQKNSYKILSFWLGNCRFSKMRKFLQKTNTPFAFKKEAIFISKLESLPITFFQKTFLYKNAFMLLPLLLYKKNKYTNKPKIIINGFFISRQWSFLLPADVVFYKKPFTITNNNMYASKNLL